MKKYVMKLKIASTLIGLLGVGVAMSADQGIPWSYDGETGPENWSGLVAEYGVCGVGTRQSPIDLEAAVLTDAMPDMRAGYSDTPLRIINNGHTVQVNYAPGSTLQVGDESFNLLQLHFHTPSEHTLAGRSYAMEGHLVHRREDGVLGVLGVMMELGEHNSMLEPIWNAMPMEAGAEVEVVEVSFNAAVMLPDVNNLGPFFRYNGSLTTPPCAEGVNWIVLETPVSVSEEQVAAFRMAVGGHANNRPLQAPHHRFILEGSD